MVKEDQLGDERRLRILGIETSVQLFYKNDDIKYEK